MSRYGFMVNFVVDEEDPELAQKKLESVMDNLPRGIEYNVEEGPDELDGEEEE